MQETKKNTILYFYLALFFLCALIIVSALFYRRGYRIVNYRTVHVGSLEVSTYQDNAKIFIDGIAEQTTVSSQEKVSFKSLTPIVHSVLVFKEGFWPWKKDVYITQNQTASVASFEVAVNPLKVQIAPESAEYEKALFAIENNSLATKETKKLSADQNVAIWAKDQNIYAEWKNDPVPSFFCNADCTENGHVTKVTHLEQEIKNLTFFKGRNDVIVFGTNEGIYAIEIDKRGIQNFEPIYRGSSLSFAEADENSLSIKEGDSIFKLGL